MQKSICMYNSILRILCNKKYVKYNIAQKKWLNINVKNAVKFLHEKVVMIII